MKKDIMSIYKKSVSFLYGTGISNLPLVSKIHKSIISNVSPDYFEIFGNKMYVKENYYQNLIFADSIYFFKNPYNILKRILNEGDTIIDIGASIGYYSLIFAKIIGKTGKVIAIEPDSNSYDLFKKNVKINNYKNITLVKKAVSDKTGKAKILKDKLGTSVIFESDSQQIGTDEIETICLDDYIKEKIDFIKIDAEGSENKIITGMKELIKKNKKLKIMTEYSPQALKLTGTEPANFLQNLTNLGFTLFDMREKDGDQIPITPEEIQKKYPLTTNDTKIRAKNTDLLCVRLNNK